MSLADRLLVVAGEPSGDRLLAEVVEELGGRAGPVDGLGGHALQAAGAHLVDHLERFGGAMGLVELVDRVPSLAKALWRLSARVRDMPPSRALLASFSTANAWIGSSLRQRQVEVTWIGPPEVWAHRPGRVAKLVRCASRFVVLLPFERELWRKAGAQAEYLGHPVLSQVTYPRAQVRTSLGMPTLTQAVALLPGSRAHEVELLLPKFLEAARMLRLPAALLLTRSLPRRVLTWAREQADRAMIPVVDVEPRQGAFPWLGGFEVALTAAGTVTLECAVAGVPPVIVQTLHPMTHAIARRLVSTPVIGLPNVLLRSVGAPERFPECIEARPTPAQMVRALEQLLDGRSVVTCARVREILTQAAPSMSFAHEVASRVLENAK